MSALANPHTAIVLVTNAISAILCTALLMLVLWQDVRRRANLYFVLLMFLFVVYSLFNAAVRFARLMEWDPVFLTYISTTALGWTAWSFFMFATEFANMRGIAVSVGRLLGALLGLVFTPALWAGKLLVNFRVNQTGGLDNDITLAGYTVFLWMVAKA